MPNVVFFFGFLNFLILTVSGFLLFLFWELLKEKKKIWVFFKLSVVVHFVREEGSLMT